MLNSTKIHVSANPTSERIPPPVTHLHSRAHLCFTSTLTLLENGLTGLWMSLVIFPGVNRQEIEKASLNVRKSERYSFTYVRSNSVPYANAYSVPSAYVTTYCILEILRGQ